MKTEMLTTEEIENLAGNIEKYTSIESYMKQTYPCSVNDTQEECELDFEDQVDKGFIQDITCGTYNGASDTFDPWEFTPRNLIQMIEHEYNEGEHEEVLSMVYEDNNESTDNLTLYEKLEFMIGMYNFIIIGHRLYMNID